MMNQFNPAITPQPAPPMAYQSFDWRKPDPIVQAVWDVKAQINKECDYSIDKVFEMARASRLARLAAG
jgi:hypothetical protein